jgi:hypothetical protein
MTNQSSNEPSAYQYTRQETLAAGIEVALMVSLFVTGASLGYFLPGKFLGNSPSALGFTEFTELVFPFIRTLHNASYRPDAVRFACAVTAWGSLLLFLYSFFTLVTVRAPGMWFAQQGEQLVKRVFAVLFLIAMSLLLLFGAEALSLGAPPEIKCRGPCPKKTLGPAAIYSTMTVIGPALLLPPALASLYLNFKWLGDPPNYGVQNGNE